MDLSDKLMHALWQSNSKGKIDCLQMLKDMLKAKNLFGKKIGICNL